MPVTPITYDAMIDHLSWTQAVEALRAGHLAPKAEVADMLLGPAEGTLLSRGAYLEGLGFGVKSVTVFERNPGHGLPAVQGAMFVFEPKHGGLEAIIDGRLVTDCKRRHHRGRGSGRSLRSGGGAVFRAPLGR